MGNLVIGVGACYAVAILVQILFYTQSVKKTKTVVEHETLEATLMTPQNV